MIMSND